MSLLLGASLSVGFEVSCLGVRLPVGKAFSQRVFFQSKSSFSDVDLLFGCQSSCWEDIFIMSLLSGAGLSVGFVISCLGVSLPVGKTCF